MAHGRMLDEDHEPLQQFFVVLEHVLRHGLRRKLSMKGGNSVELPILLLIISTNPI